MDSNVLLQWETTATGKEFLPKSVRNELSAINVIVFLLFGYVALSIMEITSYKLESIQ